LAFFYEVTPGWAGSPKEKLWGILGADFTGQIPILCENYNNNNSSSNTYLTALCPGLPG